MSAAEDAVQVLGALAAQGVQARALCADSRAIAPGEVFVAYPGLRSDARQYIGAALARGAAAVLWERDGWQWDDALGVPNVGVSGLQRLSGELAHRVHGHPSERLHVVGVTGTNGKTSVSQWVAQAFDALGRRCGVIGTLGWGFDGELLALPNTTPDAIAVHRGLGDMLAQGARACAMEVSSIGLDQGRLAGVVFHTAVLTNLTRDHLEYHGSMEAYAAAKARLFEFADLRCAVLNLDDGFGAALVQHLHGTGVRRIGYTQQAHEDHGVATEELLRAEAIELSARGLRFDIVCADGVFAVDSGLIGRFNVSNLLAVFGVLRAAGVAPAEAAAVLSTLVAPPGRMQRHGEAGEPLVVVDYAHTPDALAQALATLRESARARGGQLACVFGCGGERDPGKRAPMGEVAARLAECVIITSDNPRSEDPMAIIEHIAQGAGERAQRIVDRAAAIALAVARAGARDVVLVAGKGHEDYQEIAGRRVHFADAEHVERALQARREQRA